MCARRLPLEEVKRALMGLAGGKLVKVFDFSAKKLDDETSVRFNSGFAPKKLKIPVPLPKVVVSVCSTLLSHSSPLPPSISQSLNGQVKKDEKTSGRGLVEQERTYLCDAAIVRIMKARRQLSHAELVSLV